MPRDFVARSVAAGPHALKLVFAHFKELVRGRLVASLAFCLPRRVEANKKRATPISSYRDRRSLVNKGSILWPYFRGFDSQRFVLLLPYLFE